MKRLNKITLIIVAVIGMAISGCGGVPKCDSEDTTNVLTQIFKDNVNPKADYKYSAFMTESTNKESKKVFCKAQVTINVGNRQENEFIKYSAQYTDDGQIYVELMQ